ncbi:ring finger domain-containing protein [Hirsutella rhossiliensis]
MAPHCPQFRSINNNPSLCSAWIKSEDRCCQRQISASDKKKRDDLLLIYQRNSRHLSIEMELFRLFFCNGWHRPGGRYPINESARASQKCATW